MFEILRKDDGWHWQMVSADGRVLAYSLDAFPSCTAAAEAIISIRARFFEQAATIDCEQYKGSCPCHG